MDMAADAASPAGIGGGNGNELRAVPSRLVFRHLADLRWRHVQHGAVQPSFLPDVPPWLFNGSGRAGRHVADFQVLDDDEAVVLGYLRRCLVGGILAPPCQFRLEPGDGHLSLPAVPRTFRPPRQPLLQGRQIPAFLVAGARQHDRLSGGERHRLGNARVDAHGGADIGQRSNRLNLALDRDIPAIRLATDRGRLRLPFQGTMLDPVYPPRLGQKNPLRRDLELLRIGITKAVAVSALTELREGSPTVEEVLERFFQIDDGLLKRVIGDIAQPGRFVLEYREFLDLVIGGQASRIAAMPFQAPLLQAEIVDEAVRPRRLPEQGLLFGGRIQTIAVCLERDHSISILGLIGWSKQMETEYRRGRSVVCALHVHLVFVTKYRRGVFTDRAHVVLRDAFLGVCAEFGAGIAGGER